MIERPRIVIGGTGSGVGKTTITLGLMAAFKRRGLRVQGFKTGPDYIDPTYHTAVTGRPSRNLDTWMSSAAVMQEIFLRGSEGADLSIIEGVMGYYDGKDPRSNQGSTAEISLLLQAPTLLTVNIASMARSAAAIVKGFCTLTEGVPVAGVIANQAGSQGHVELVRAAVEQECGIPLLGGLLRTERIEIPERHLGLIPAVERGELQPLFDRLADLFEAQLNLDAILRIAQSAPPLSSGTPVLFTEKKPPVVKIAVAKDAAFNFYYPENLELLEQDGAELLYFSPLAGEKCPTEADALYIGGGFPEEFAAELAAQAAVSEDLRLRIQQGLPTFAECGGYMYLCRSLQDRAGETHEMLGLIPCAIKMQDRLAALGYRQVTAAEASFVLPEGVEARGHEFHYSQSQDLEAHPHAYVVQGMRGEKKEGFVQGNLVAGYTHLYFPSNPELSRQIVAAAKQFREQKCRMA